MEGRPRVPPSAIGRAARSLVERRFTVVSDGMPFDFEEVPYPTVVNWILVELSARLRLSRPLGMPTHVQLEPTSRCNLRCALCPVTEGMARGGQHMELDLYRRFVDEAGRHLLIMYLWDWGEPFVHPQVYDMIRYARRHRTKIVSSTNGHLFARPEEARRLVEDPPDALIIAMDGATQETYERYRQGGRLDTVLAGLRNLVEAKRQAGSELPLLNLRFIPMRHNEHEVPAVKRLARHLGVDMLSLKTLNPYSNDTYHEHREERAEYYEAFLPVDPFYRRFRYADDGRRVPRDPPCKNLWNAPSLHANGVVCPCTYDYNEDLAFGRLGGSSFREIWFGRPYAEARARFRLDHRSIGLCRNCSYAYEGGSCTDETIVEILHRPGLERRFDPVRHRIRVTSFAELRESPRDQDRSALHCAGDND